MQANIADIHPDEIHEARTVSDRVAAVLTAQGFDRAAVTQRGDVDYPLDSGATLRVAAPGGLLTVRGRPSEVEQTIEEATQEANQKELAAV